MFSLLFNKYKKIDKQDNFESELLIKPNQNNKTQINNISNDVCKCCLEEWCNYHCQDTFKTKIIYRLK